MGTTSFTNPAPISGTVPLAPKLRAEDLGFGVLFWTMRDAVVVGDVVTGAIVLWNPAAERLFGWSADEVVGRSIEFLIPSHLRDAHHTGFTRYAASGRGPLVDSGSPVEVPARHKDSSELTIELSLTPLTAYTTASGVPHYILAVIRDATARQELRAEREALLATAQATTTRLEELAELKASFTSMVAHELGSPLAAVQALVDLLSRGIVPPEDQPSVLRSIRTEIHLLRRLVGDVAATAAIERDDFSVRVRSVPLAVLLTDAAAFARTLPGDHPIGEAITESARVSQVLADPERIGQVLRNLLGNAAKHTPPGTPIEVRVHQDGKQVRLEVADAGPGIPAGELERIFTKFGRGRDAEGNHTPGMGLGLYLSRRIIQEHGSELTVVSHKGEGTVFGFELGVTE